MFEKCYIISYMISQKVNCLPHNILFAACVNKSVGLAVLAEVALEQNFRNLISV